MKPKFEKIDADDFDGLLPTNNHPPVTMNIEPAASIGSQATDSATEDAGQQATLSKPSKSKNAKPTAGISIRLSFSIQDYKNLSLLALSEGDKLGKRVSVTSLLLQQANKLIKKGNTNA